MRQIRHRFPRMTGLAGAAWRAASKTVEDLRQVATEHPAVLDALLATALLVAAVIGLSGDVRGVPGVRGPDPLTYLFSVLGIVPYYFRRRSPLLVLLVASVPLFVLVQRDNTPGALGAGAFILAYTIAAWCDRRSVAAAVLIVATMLVLIRVTDPSHLHTSEFVTNVVLFTGAFVAGAWAQTRRRYIGWVEERTALIERDRELVARQAVADERVRIAQELHDVVAHSMGVIAVQAGTGLHVIDDQPGEAKRSLAAISDTSRAALAEIRQILGALRSTDGDGDTPGYTPTPGMADLDRLVAETRATGLDVTCRVTGRAGAIPLGIDLAAYRVSQEALTNALKHAPGSTVEVLVGYEPDAVTVTVADSGPRAANAATPAAAGTAAAGTGAAGTGVAGTGVAATSNGSGHGLIGMRERVTAWGGTLEAGPTPTGGFRVDARIPYGERS